MMHVRLEAAGAAARLRMVPFASRQAALSLAAVALCLCSLRPAVAAENFSYGKQSGPSHWGGTCQVGKSQSPVNIVNATQHAATAVDLLHFTYKVTKGAMVANTGHGPQVISPPGNLLETGSSTWQLLQYHFHTPSENALDGRRAPIEAHLVHKNVKTGELAVVGVLLEAPTARRFARSAVWNSALAQALALLPRRANEKSGPHNLAKDTFASLIPGSNRKNGRRLRHKHIHFSGSLTTPPCTEGLSWYVLLDPGHVHAAQVLAFQRVLGKGRTLDFNARPVQPLNGRKFD